VSFKTRNVRLGIKVTRWDSKYIPFTHEMFFCKQRDDFTVDWARESVSLLGVLGGVPGECKIEVGETRKYWCHATLVYSTDYWGEADEDVEFITVKRIQ